MPYDVRDTLAGVVGSFSGVMAGMPFDTGALAG